MYTIYNSLPEGHFWNKVEVKCFYEHLIFNLFGLDMIMRRPVWLAISLCLPFLLCQSCLSHSEFAVISSKDINLSKVRIKIYKQKGETQGKDCHYAILFFTIGEPTNLEKALQKSLLAKRADVLLDADVHWQFVWVPFIYTQECWKVEGTAYEIFS